VFNVQSQVNWPKKVWDFLRGTPADTYPVLLYFLLEIQLDEAPIPIRARARMAGCPNIWPLWALLSPIPDRAWVRLWIEPWPDPLDNTSWFNHLRFTDFLLDTFDRAFDGLDLASSRVSLP
jgi:hypothetical protein